MFPGSWGCGLEAWHTSIGALEFPMWRAVAGGRPDQGDPKAGIRLEPHFSWFR